MHKIILASAAAAALLAGCASSAEQTAANADPNRQICKRFAVTGSRTSERECHTAAEWAALEGRQHQDARDSADSVRNGGRGNDAIIEPAAGG